MNFCNTYICHLQYGTILLDTYTLIPQTWFRFLTGWIILPTRFTLCNDVLRWIQREVTIVVYPSRLYSFKYSDGVLPLLSPRKAQLTSASKHVMIVPESAWGFMARICRGVIPSWSIMDATVGPCWWSEWFEWRHLFGGMLCGEEGYYCDRSR